MDLDPSHQPDAAASSSHAESALTTLQPAAHRDKFLHLQTSARYAGSSDATARLNHIFELLQAYRNAAELIPLLPHDWDVFLALETRLAAATNPLTPESLHTLFELHKNATLQYQSVDLIKRYISLVLTYFSRLHGVDASFFAGQTGPANHASDPALKWTSLDSCPTIDPVQSTYIPVSLPPIASESSDLAAWEPVCGLEAVRWRIREAYTRCAYQLHESQDVWKLYLAFEEALLASGQIARDQQLETIRHVYLARFKVPHAAIDETFQAFSSFVTQHLPPQQYESEMSAANVLVAESRSGLRQREQYEDPVTSLLRSGNLRAPGSRQDLDSFAVYCKPYLRWQSYRAVRAMRSKDKAVAQTELDFTCGLFERMIPHFGLHPPSTQKHELAYYSDDVQGSEHYSRQFKRLSQEERDARTQQEQQLYSERLALATDLWLDYIRVLTSSSRPDASLIMDVCTRAVQCLPTATSLHAALLRNSARFRRSRPQIDQFFEKVVTPGALQLKASELTDLCLARIDCERELAAFDLVVKAGRELDADPAQDMDKFTEIYALLSYSLGKLAELDERDPSLRLEKCTVDWVERAVFALGGPASEGGAGFNELAETVWQTAVTQQPDNALVYREAAAYWSRRFDAKKARGWFKAGVSKLERKQQDAAQAGSEYQTLLQEWVQFEHQHGSIEDVVYAEGKARAERQRALEAWYASYAQYGYQPEAQAQQTAANGDASTAMQVEAPPAEQSTAAKRKADDDEDITDASFTDVQVSTRDAEASKLVDNAVVEQPKKTRTSDADSTPARDREHCSVLVSNLDPSTDAQAVRSLLRGCGRIVELSGPTILTSSDGTTTSAAALVEFADANAAASALTRHNKPVNGTFVSIFIGWKCTLFVTNFPEEWDDAHVRNAFAPYGLIFTVRWPSKRFVSTRRFCYVQYTTPDAAASAVAALDNTEVAPGRQLNVALSDPSRRKQRSDANENAKELFVSGFPRNITEEELKTYFEEYGTVKGVRLLRNAEGGLRGIGFVDFDTVLDAHRAMKELNSTKWRGKTLSVTIAENRGAHGAANHQHKPAAGEKGKKDVRDRKERSVRVEGLPADAQEALIQQVLERCLGLGSVKQVFWKPDGSNRRATVEFHSAADAGKAVLLGGAASVRYDDEHLLTIIASDDVSSVADIAASPAGSTGQQVATQQPLAFVPRASRGGRGRGRGRAFGVGFSHSASSAAAPSASASASGNADGAADVAGAGAGDDMDVEPTVESNTESTKLTGQDRFRAMLQRPQ